MGTGSRLLAALFLSALLGTLAVVGVALSSLGWPVLTGYVALVLVALGLMVRRARALLAQQRHRSGRTCTCCTSTVFDPVEVR